MDPDLVWFDLRPLRGVLELHERLTWPAPALELHILITPAGVVAWWLDHEGRWLREAEVGTA